MEQQLTERGIVCDLDVCVDTRDLADAVSGRPAHLVDDHVDGSGLSSLREPDADDVSIGQVLHIQLGDRAVHAVRAGGCQGNEPSEPCNLIGCGLPAVEEPWLVDRGAWREFVLVGENVVIAQNINARIVANERSERPGHDECVVGVCEANGSTWPGWPQTSTRIGRGGRWRRHYGEGTQEAHLLDIHWQAAVGGRKQVAWSNLRRWQLLANEQFDGPDAGIAATHDFLSDADALNVVSRGGAECP
jgi:hypothetical protein